ncbi:MAG: PIG-L family deacetylase [Dokdonella sp.]
MTSVLDLDNFARLLIVVPHPDDETLATGGLIQRALAVGATLRVVIVTDGDNNPWPQRWVEKRWRIDAEARARWGKRRRHEAAAALARLGMAEYDIRHYGWPDQGLTDLLMCDAQCEDQLVAEILDFAPTLAAAPSLTDRHPDHNALRVMLELALARTAFAACRRLGFVVHGRLSESNVVTLETSEEQVRKKCGALQAHTSQLILSSKRMTRLCERSEQFEVNEPPASEFARVADREWRIAFSRSGFHLHQRALYLVVEIDGKVIRAKFPLPVQHEGKHTKINMDDHESYGLEVDAGVDHLRISLAGDRATGQIFAKIERLGARLLIYDCTGWMRG